MRRSHSKGRIFIRLSLANISITILDFTMGLAVRTMSQAVLALELAYVHLCGVPAIVNGYFVGSGLV